MDRLAQETVKLFGFLAQENQCLLDPGSNGWALQMLELLLARGDLVDQLAPAVSFADIPPGDRASPMARISRSSARAGSGTGVAAGRITAP